MTSGVARLSGRCHCGNIELLFETELPIDRLPLRACACSFCSSHGARCTSDPQGRVWITVHDPDRLSRYQFGLRTADFLICKTCGVYMGALLNEGDSAWATVNVNTLELSDGLGPNPVTVKYDAETEAGRRARRKERWTPAVLKVGELAP